MAPWNAREVSTIGNAEVIGRRRFKHPDLRGAAGQKKPVGGLDTRDFLEKRDTAISIDRLGKSGIDRKVLNYLLPRAEAHGLSQKPTKEFLGWACVQASKFLEMAGKYGYLLIPSPVPGVVLADNDYHAHISYPNTIDAFHAALLVKEIFQQHGSVHDIDVNSPAPERKSLRQRCMILWGNLWGS
jgi:hypothetical protein